MKSKKNKKIIYEFTSIVAVLVLCIGIAINYNNPTNEKSELGTSENPNVEDLEKKQNSQESDTIIFNTGSIESSADIDAKWVVTDIATLFPFIKEINIPYSYYKCIRQGKVYVRENIEDSNYSKLQQYSVIYSIEEDNSSIEIIFTEEDKILSCIIPHDLSNSIISGYEVKLFKVENSEDKTKINGEAFFEHNGYKFYISSYKIDESDFINVVKSILEQNIISNTADKDINVNEQPNENIDTGYPDYYAGKYIDKNGNNVVLLCENNETNKKAICKLLGITESKTTFKTAKYSYNYLTELQNKISQKMIDKEFTFVTSSAIMEDSNNIKVTVTSNNESDLNKIKELDRIGGAIDIEYNTNTMSRQE